MLGLLALLALLRLLNLLTIVDCLILLLGRLFLFIQFLLNLKVFFLCPAALPAVLPVADQEVEAECINFHARLEANAKVAVVHFVLVDIGVQEVEVASDGKKKVIVIRRQFGKFIFQHLWRSRRTLAFLSN